MYCYRSRDRAKYVKLLLKIFNNIINNPSNEKYRNLNFNAINKKINSNKLCLNILNHCGFYKSPDGNRLLFDSKNINKLKRIKLLLLQSQNNNNNTNNHDIQELMSDGWSFEEAKQAITMSQQTDKKMIAANKPLQQVHDIFFYPEVV